MLKQVSAPHDPAEEGKWSLAQPGPRRSPLPLALGAAVEVGQACVALTVLAVTAVLIKLNTGLPRRLAVNLAAAALAGIGLNRFPGRAYVYGGDHA